MHSLCLLQFLMMIKVWHTWTSLSFSLSEEISRLIRETSSILKPNCAESQVFKMYWELFQVS